MASIAIADDDDLVVELLSFKLQQRGHAVVSLQDGETVLSRLAAEPADLLVLDFQLSSLSSAEIIRALHEHSSTAAMPIIVLSSAWREQDVLDALSAGVSDFMTKPFSPDELLLRIELALRRSGKPGAPV